MSEFTKENIEQVLDAVCGSVDVIGDAIAATFGRRFRIEVGKPLDWANVAGEPAWDAPGIIVPCEVGEQVMLCLVPASLPLPDGYANPNADEASSLEAFAECCATSMLPAEWQAKPRPPVAVEKLSEAVSEGEPAAWATALQLTLVSLTDESANSESASSEEDSAGTDQATDAPTNSEAATGMLLVWPVSACPATSAVLTGAAQTDKESSAEEPSERAQSAAKMARQQIHLKKTPVTVSVRLAEKRVELGQLLTMAPGMLIMFNKSCEDLLDLYVNNSAYCQGEAVKIGEKFGLRISGVGAAAKREPGIVG
jgi:flagellar motor switch protein FliN/FliY